MSTVTDSDGAAHEVQEAGLRWVERDGVWRARGDSGLYEVRHSHGKFHVVWRGHGGEDVELGGYPTLAEAFGAARRFTPSGQRAAEGSPLVLEFPSRQAADDFADYFVDAPLVRHHRVVEVQSSDLEVRSRAKVVAQMFKGHVAAEGWACEDCVGIHTHDVAAEEARPRYLLYTVDDDFDSFGKAGLERFIKVNDFDGADPKLAKLLRDMRPGETHRDGGGAQPEWAIARLGSGEREQTVKDRLRADRYDRASKVERELSPQAGARETRLTYDERKNLPPSAFALPKRRELPLTDGDGNLDPVHIDNAPARLSMMDHEGSVTKRELESAKKKIAEARAKLGMGPSAYTSAAEGGYAIAARDQAAVERGQKVGPLPNPKAIFAFVRTEMLKSSQEAFVVVPLDVNSCPLNDKPYLVALGQRSSVNVDTADVLRPVGETNASGFAVCHSHPGGTRLPSKADRELTERIKTAAREAYPKVTFVDHLVVAGRDRYYSFAEEKAHKVE